jgi:hypothetical protein
MMNIEAQQHNVNGRSVLQEDRVGGGGQLCGGNEQELGRDGSACCQQLPAIPTCGQPPQVSEKYKAGK